jgi:hypothetical protein
MGLMHTYPTDQKETPPLDVSIMTPFSFGQARYVWRRTLARLTPTGAPRFEDQMAIIGDKSYNAVGFRTDDFPNSVADAKAEIAKGNLRSVLSSSPINPTQSEYLVAGVISHNFVDGVTKPPILDTGDVFMFHSNPADTTTITLHVDHLVNDLRPVLHLYDANGQRIATVVMADASLSDMQLVLPLADGDYFAEVQSTGAPGNAGQYLLSIIVPANNGGGTTGVPVPLPDDQFEPNDDSLHPADLGAIGLGQELKFTGLTINIHPATGSPDVDWYRVTSSQSGTLTADIKYVPNPTGDLHIRLMALDPTGQLVELGSSRLLNVREQKVAIPVQAGQKILIWIYGFNNAQGTYDMTLDLN